MQGGRVTDFDTRAIANIATAPATRNDRRWASFTTLVLVAMFLFAIPLGRVSVGAGNAFVSTIVGASIIALAITAILLYVQYRIERDGKLALLAIAYAYGATSLLLYLLTFPNMFTAHGLLWSGPQTAAWWYFAAHAGFAAFVIAQGFVARSGVRLRRDQVRWLAVGTGVAVLALTALFGLGEWLLPPLITAQGTFMPLWTNVLAPLLCVVILVGAIVVAGRFETVSQTWLAVVLLTRALDVFTGSDLGGARYSVDWYIARLDTLIGALAVLAVFLVKINDLMLRLAARNRSTAEALAVGEARYASLANVVPQLIFTTNAQGVIEYVNDRWVAYTELDLNATRDKGWLRAVDPDQVGWVRERWEHSVHTGESFSVDARLREDASGRLRWFLIGALPVRDPGNAVVAWIATCTDINAQKSLEEREAFLARAGEGLVASLDVATTVGSMKALLIPRLADRLWVALLDEDERYVLRGVGSTDPADEVEARHAIGMPLPPALHDAIEPIIEGGDAVLIEHPERFPDPWVQAGAPGSAVVAPLVSGDTPIGVLTLVRGERPYDAGDVGLAREFTRRAALSLEHARLYERERTTADALQRAMLPSQLPILPDVRFSASYSAASESQRVGGDFYDAFALADGRVAITIGDVTGHGLEAAVIMGEIRQALRAAAFESAEPSAILDRASRLLVASGRGVFATAIFGVLDPVTGHFAYASAGHPAPLLDNGDGLVRLRTAGLPIGLRDDEGVDFGLRLHAPCTLVLFTDGLMEFARDLDEGERRIEAAIRKLAHEEIDHLAGALMKEVLGEDVPTDDIAILTVTIEHFATELPGEEYEWRFASSDASTGRMVRHEIGALVRRWTARPDVGLSSELAFGELIANAVRHAPGPVYVVASSDADGNATITVEDSGVGFTPTARRLDPLAESGRGLELVRAIADDVRIERASRGGTRVAAVFRAQPALVASASA